MKNVINLQGKTNCLIVSLVSWIVLAKASMISVLQYSWAQRLWPVGVAVQVLSFLTTFSRIRKLFKCMRPLQSVQCCNFHWCSLLYPVVLTWYVGLACFLVFFFNILLFLPVLQTSWFKMSVCCVWDVCYLAGSYGFWFGYSSQTTCYKSPLWLKTSILSLLWS